MKDKRILLRGIIDNEGKRKMRPVIVTLNADDRVIKYEFLDGHEPHSTTFDPTRLLDIQQGKMV